MNWIISITSSQISSHALFTYHIRTPALPGSEYFTLPSSFVIFCSNGVSFGWSFASSVLATALRSLTRSTVSDNAAGSSSYFVSDTLPKWHLKSCVAMVVLWGAYLNPLVTIFVRAQYILPMSPMIHAFSDTHIISSHHTLSHQVIYLINPYSHP